MSEGPLPEHVTEFLDQVLAEMAPDAVGMLVAEARRYDDRAAFVQALKAFSEDLDRKAEAQIRLIYAAADPYPMLKHLFAGANLAMASLALHIHRNTVPKNPDAPA